MSGERAVVLLSGGLDSTTVLAIARSEGFAAYALSFSLRAAARGGTRRGAAGRRGGRGRGARGRGHRPPRVRRLGADGGHRRAEGRARRARSARASRSRTCRRATRSSCRSRWPGPRCSAASDIFIGVNALDYCGYPDCRPEYIEAFERMANLATKAGVEGTQRLTIHAPLIQLTKARSSAAGSSSASTTRPTQQLLRPRRAGPRLRPLRLVPAAPARVSRRRASRIPPRTSGAAVAGMTYTVKEIFYTLQGEGAHAGRPAVFCRFAGCNLWTGREEDRARRDLPVLRHRLRRHRRRRRRQVPRPPTTSPSAVAARWPRRTAAAAPLVVCTGGEPLLQLDAAAVDALHDAGFEVAVETNGTLAPPAGIDWICVSPKAGADSCCCAGDELKLVYPQAGAPTRALRRRSTSSTSSCSRWTARTATRTPSAPSSTASTHPQWRLSLQTHKYLGIP